MKNEEVISPQFVTEAGLTEDDVRETLDQVKGFVDKLRTEIIGKSHS